MGHAGIRELSLCLSLTNLRGTHECQGRTLVDILRYDAIAIGRRQSYASRLYSLLEGTEMLSQDTTYHLIRLYAFNILLVESGGMMVDLK